jgi:hypothetical protein
MKTLKILLVFCAITIFCMGNVMAQNQKTTVVTTEEFTLYSICGEENITGTETFEMTFWNNGYLGKWSFTAVGETSGAIYEGHGIEPFRYIDKPLSGEGMTITHTGLVRRNGLPISMVHYTYNLNITPDGVARVDHWLYNFRCL